MSDTTCGKNNLRNLGTFVFPTYLTANYGFRQLAVSVDHLHLRSRAGAWPLAQGLPSPLHSWSHRVCRR